MVFGGDLDAHLEVLTDVSLEHCLEALQRVLHRQRAKIVHQPLKTTPPSSDHLHRYIITSPQGKGTIIIKIKFPTWNG